MESLLGPLLPLFERERAAGRAVALGVLVETKGSTYRKPGALMLIAANGDSAGLLSGGCLEGDLARAEPKKFRYCLLHAAGIIARTGRRTRLRIADNWPWVSDLVRAFDRVELIALRT